MRQNAISIRKRWSHRSFRGCSRQKYQELSALSTDFMETVKTHGRLIIEEVRFRCDAASIEVLFVLAVVPGRCQEDHPADGPWRPGGWSQIHHPRHPDEGRCGHADRGSGKPAIPLRCVRGRFARLVLHLALTDLFCGDAGGSEPSDEFANVRLTASPHFVMTSSLCCLPTAEERRSRAQGRDQLLPLPRRL